MKFVIVGSALAGNKGAAAMLESSIQTLSKRFRGAEFTLLSMYPSEDSKLNSYKNLKIMPASPLVIGLVINPAALIYKLFPFMRESIAKWVPQIKAIRDADALLDQGGITFSDGREVFLLYNVASILPALMVGTKVVKCAQALGPFKNPINKAVSKLVLPRLDLIIARGKKTKSYLDGIGLKNTALATDYAFSLDITPQDEAAAKEVLKKARVGKKSGKLNIGLSPSVVVYKKCLKSGIDYVGLMVWFVDYLQGLGYLVTLVPHSVRTDPSKTHNNDLPLCANIYERIKNKEACVFIDQDVSSQALRFVIGKTDLFVACRFHAMVSSLAMAVPTLVLGWSHKYAEILDVFGVEEFGVDSSKLSRKVLKKNFTKLLDERKAVAARLKSSLPLVRKLSAEHTELIAAVLGENQRLN